MKKLYFTLFITLFIITATRIIEKSEWFQEQENVKMNYIYSELKIKHGVPSKLIGEGIDYDEYIFKLDDGSNITYEVKYGHQLASLFFMRSERVIHTNLSDVIAKKILRDDNMELFDITDLPFNHALDVIDTTIKKINKSIDKYNEGICTIPIEIFYGKNYRNISIRYTTRDELKKKLLELKKIPQ